MAPDNCRFFDRESPEESQLDDLALARIEVREALHRVIKGKQVYAFLRNRRLFC